MKNIKKIITIVMIALFIVVSICCKKMHSLDSLIGGWFASFIISWLFYQHIMLLIKPQFKEKVIFEIVTKFIGHRSANKDTLNKEIEKDSIEAELLKKFFPETFRFVEDYNSKFTQLFKNHNISSNYVAFATGSELRFHKEATEKDKSEVIEARKKFIEKLNKIFYKDLKD